MVGDLVRVLIPILGPTSLLLLVGCVYLGWQLQRAANYRDKKEAEWQAFLASESVARINAFNETAKSFIAMQGTIATAVDAIERLEQTVTRIIAMQEAMNTMLDTLERLERRLEGQR